MSRRSISQASFTHLAQMHCLWTRVSPLNSTACFQCLCMNTAGSHYETFKKWHEEDQMAVDKLKEGIDSFAKDQESLEKLIGELKDHV